MPVGIRSSLFVGCVLLAGRGEACNNCGSQGAEITETACPSKPLTTTLPEKQPMEPAAAVPMATLWRLTRIGPTV